MTGFPSRYRRLHVCVWLAIVCSAGVASAQDGEWRRWGGAGGDFVVETRQLAERWPASGPRELWSRTLGAGHSSILAVGDRLFTMYRVSHSEGGGAPWTPNDTVLALDASTGETLWEYTYPSMNQDFDQGAGPHATPLLTDGRLFTMGSNKELHVFNPETGALLWSKNLITDFGAPPLLIRSMIKPGSGMSPIPYKDTILLQVGGPGQAVMALRQDDGEVVWRSGSFLVSHAPIGLIEVAGRTQAVAFAGQGVFGLDPDTGQVLWGHPHDAGNDFNFQIPVYDEETRVLFFSSGYIGGSQAIRLIPDGDLTHTELLWSDRRLRFTFLNVLKLGDFIYGTSGQGATAILTATHMETGETAWRERGFSRATMVHGDGKALLLEEDGDLSLVRLSPNGLETLATTHLFTTRSWSVPTLVGTTLYARDRERIVALDLGVP
ncbi:MAG: PQQ-binding-like beta-propeller repeat protein [Acidobacteriota bacterium]|nr:PQQ-binding-like beta-propeller repeat protein [Acidobacteriota bacterium]